MSMMQRLRALRGRMAAQAEAERAPTLPQPPAAPGAATAPAEPGPLRVAPGGSPTASMWNLVDDLEADDPLPVALAIERASRPPAAAHLLPADEPPPVERRSGRVRTRLLGHGVAAGPAATAEHQAPRYSVGWVVIVRGPGRGTAIPLLSGVSKIGRGESQQIRLNFGDDAVSSENHAALAYDDEQRSFFVGPGTSPNPIRLNGRPLLSTEAISHGDQISLGETTLRLVAACGRGFSWADTAERSSAIQEQHAL